MHDALPASPDQYAALAAPAPARAPVLHLTASQELGGSLACPTCGPGEARLRFGERSGHRLVRCGGCGLVFLERLGGGVNARFYADASHIDAAPNKDAIEYWSFPAMYDRHRAVFDGFFEERWTRLQAVRPGIRRLLDIGCGYGFFAAHVAARGVEVKGIEIDPKVAAHARDHFGLDVSEAPIETYSSRTRFDCIVMCDVLEHLSDPKGGLERCRALLAPGGVLFLQVPNLVGFKLPFGHSWGLPHHIWQFEPRSLARLVSAAGLEQECWYTGVLGVIGVYERGGPRWTDRLIWALARKLRLGNRLMLIARKPLEGA